VPQIVRERQHPDLLLPQSHRLFDGKKQQHGNASTS
jgi:hypothetical protein